MKVGYKVNVTDYVKHNSWKDKEGVNSFIKFSVADIFDLNTFPIKTAPIVICSEVLEHLPKYKKAIKMEFCIRINNRISKVNIFLVINN